MPRVLILCLHRPERAPGQRFRFEQYLPHLTRAGYQFDFSYLLSESDDRIFYRPGHYAEKARVVVKSCLTRLRELLSWRRYDLVFVQREAIMLGTSFIETFLGRRLPLIFDFDDSIWLPNTSEANRKLAFLKRPGKTADIIAHSALVLAGNEYLAAYARQFCPEVVIMPTTIDTDSYQPRAESARESLCIGWSGSFSTIKYFELAIPALLEVRRRFGPRVCFKVIGEANFRCPELDLVGQRWQADTEVADLQEIDIGLMPMPDDEWSRGKCGLKGLQYMALKIPTLMSPIGVNKEIIEPGVNGYLPTTREEWVENLSSLVESPADRQRMGEAGRQTVEQGYSVRRWRKRYQELFDSTLARKPARR